MTHHLWIFYFRNTAWLSIFSGDIQLGRVHSSRTNIREAFSPCGRKAGWLWVKPTVGETAALHLFGNQTRHFYSSYEHPPNRVRVPTLFKVARESTEWGVRGGRFGAWTSVPAQPFPYSKTWSPLYPDGHSVTSQCWHSLTGSSSWSQLYNMKSLNDHLLSC